VRANAELLFERDAAVPQKAKQRGSRLGNADKAHGVFSGLRTLMPEAAQAPLQDLEDICDEARQLVRQEQLHRCARLAAGAYRFLWR
jgi:hypothetical protein